MPTYPMVSEGYLAQLREDIQNCAARLAPASLQPLPKRFDGPLLAALDDRLSAALQQARENATSLVKAHQVEFPDSPLFLSCSLLRPLGQSRRELSVTQVLGWLLDPNADHGFKKILLGGFLALLKNDSDAERKIHECDDADISVYTEFALGDANRADIVIVCPGHAIVVEAKVDAREGETQTERYRRDFEKSFTSCTFVYLTRGGTQAADAGFGSLRYLELVRTLLQVLPSGRAAEGFHYARYFLAGMLDDLCGIRTSGKIEEVLQGNSFKLEILLESQPRD